VKTILIALLLFIVLSTAAPTYTGASVDASRFCLDAGEFLTTTGACATSWANWQITEAVASGFCTLNNDLVLPTHDQCIERMRLAMSR